MQHPAIAFRDLRLLYTLLQQLMYSKNRYDAQLAMRFPVHRCLSSVRGWFVSPTHSPDALLVACLDISSELGAIGSRPMIVASRD